MKLTITITTGNDACQTEEDILYYLKETIARLRKTNFNITKVLDINGQTVGTVEIEP